MKKGWQVVKKVLILSLLIAFGQILRETILDAATGGHALKEGQQAVLAADEVVHVTCDPGTDISDEIQDAVDTLEPLGGGVIYLPGGDFQFTDTVHMPGGTSIIGQGQGETILRSDSSSFFDINHYGDQGGALRITGISFCGAPESSGTSTHGGIALYNVVDFRIDHCTFERIRYNVSVRSREGYPQSRGVVDHCSFVAADLGSVYGVFDTRYGSDWDAAETKFLLGTAEATFIEDCTFEDVSHAAASFDGGHYVLRHSTIVDSGSIDAHGPGFGCCDRGARASEIYENKIYHHPESHGWTAIGLRAGGGVIFNNTFQNFDHHIRFSIDTTGYEATNGNYPTLDQVTDMWIWDNTLIDIAYDPSQPGYEDDFSNPNRTIVSGILLYQNEAGILIQKDRDFHLREPNMGEDGITYTPYVYPHPLTRELTLTGKPADQAIHLTWAVTGTLPLTTTWRVDYYSQTVTLSETIGASTARTHTLTGLTNYQWYTVTLTAVGTTPVLSDTVRVMPTNIFAYLPSVMKED